MSTCLVLLNIYFCFYLLMIDLFAICGNAKIYRFQEIVQNRFFIAEIDSADFSKLSCFLRPRKKLHKYAFSEDKPVIFFEPSRALNYSSLGNDFGPLDLVNTIRYMRFVESLSAEIKVHVIPKGSGRENISNAIVLAAAFMIFSENSEFPPHPPSEFLSALSGWNSAPFRDVLEFSTFSLSVRGVVGGLWLAARNGWLNNWRFMDVEKIEKEQSVAGGDMNWMVPKKFIAFAGPGCDGQDEEGQEVLEPDFYFDIFKSGNVTDVIRLNSARYDSRCLTNIGIKHHDLYFEDGSCPPINLVKKFIAIADKAEGAIAVHCKAGLGRTATLIACWMMLKYGASAQAAIGWCRIARSGSVLGPQQHFLVEWEKRIRLKPPTIYRRSLSKRSRSSTPPRSENVESGNILGSESAIGKYGQSGQGANLLSRKRSKIN